MAHVESQPEPNEQAQVDPPHNEPNITEAQTSVDLDPLEIQLRHTVQTSSDIAGMINSAYDVGAAAAAATYSRARPRAGSSAGSMALILSQLSLDFKYYGDVTSKG